MNKPTNQQLMERIILRLQADSESTVMASSRQLTQTTTQLIDHVRQLNAAFSAPGLTSESLGQKLSKLVVKR